MKSFFARLGGKKKDRNLESSSSDLLAGTPHRGLLDRGLSTSSAASPNVPDPVRTRLDLSGGRAEDGVGANSSGSDVRGVGPSKRTESSARERAGGEQRHGKRDERRKKEKAKRDSQGKKNGRKLNGKDREVTTPGSPGSVTVGKRSAMVSTHSGDSRKERQGQNEATSSSVTSQSVSVGTAPTSEFRNSQQSEQEYYASLQQAMVASMAENTRQSDRRGQGPLASATTQPPMVPLPPSTTSYLPDTPSEAPDLHVARAMAESQFAARQADELQKARDSLFDAAVSKAMEASISTADYDHLLRDMKMWMIDLDATSDDVLSELMIVRKREEEIAGKIEKALEKGDRHRLTRLLWEQENLPEVKRRIEALQETMVPVAIASSDLQSLRERILSSYPPITESQKARDKIIEDLFKSLKGALRSRSEVEGRSGRDASGASTSKSSRRQTIIQTSEDCQDSSDLRSLVIMLVDDAKKIPRAPESIVKEAKAMVRNAFKEQQASVNLSDLVAPEDSDREKYRDERDSESKTEVSSIKSTATELQTLIKHSAVDSGALSGEREVRDEDLRASSNKEELQRLKKADVKKSEDPMTQEPPRGPTTLKHGKPGATPTTGVHSASTTTAKPFNLSKSRMRVVDGTKGHKNDLPPIRRVPAFFSLTHELLTDKGVVSQSVDWQSKEYLIESFASKYHTIPAPVNVDEFYSEDVHELLSYVKKHARSFGQQPKSANIPTSSKHEEKWYTMVEVAGAVEGLLSACETFLTWKLPESDSLSESISASCHSLKHLVTQTLSIIADTAYAHDTLRVAIKKHRLPWDENLISQVRWDAQHAASIIMQAAIDCSEDQERKRGFKRSTTQRNVLKPLGQAVIATFAVHQLSGGFGGEAALICDQLVDLCVHYARQLDPKWFRGTKVVR